MENLGGAVIFLGCASPPDACESSLRFALHFARHLPGRQSMSAEAHEVTRPRLIEYLPTIKIALPAETRISGGDCHITADK